MANLLDTIKKSLSGGEAPQGPELGQTMQVQELMRGKTGRAIGPESGPRQTALGERMAASQARQGLEQVQQQGQIQGAQIEQQEADIQQREEQQTAEFQQKREEQRNQLLQSTLSSLDEFSRGERKLDNAKDIADMEQLGVMARLQNEQYITELNREGTRQRLEDMNEFSYNLAASEYDDDMKMLMDEYAFRNMMQMDDRDFEEALATINADAALNLALQKSDAANREAMINAGTEGLSNIFNKVADKGGWFSKG